jgi:hypothetical protein
VFETLATGIHELSIPLCDEAITEVLALRDRLAAKISDAVSDFDRAGLWDLDSATSMTAWLRQYGAMTKREAGRAKKLRELPVTSAAWQAGELSGGQVEAIVAVIKPEMVALFAQHEAELVPSLVGLSVADTAGHGPLGCSCASPGRRTRAPGVQAGSAPVPDAGWHLGAGGVPGPCLR